MSSKKTDNTLLLPGSHGWDIWEGSNEGGYERTLQSDVEKASELEKISTPRLVMGFPSRQALSVPFRVQTQDETLFADLADMHLEKAAIQPEADAGVLSDVFSAGEIESGSQLMAVVLAAPASDSMPVSSPGGFDISARFFPLAPTAVTLWRELGRWSFAVTGGVSGTELLYFQSLSGSRLDAEAARDVRLSLLQLDMQSVCRVVKTAVIWVNDDGDDPTEHEIASFGQVLGAEIYTEPKPSPRMPERISRLVPADVRAEQRRRVHKIKRNSLIAALLIVYLGLAAYFAYGYSKLSTTLAGQEKELEGLNLQYLGVESFNEDWQQLAPVVESKHWPLMLLRSAHSQIVRGHDIRFREFEATRENITIQGDAADLGQTSSYAEKLRRVLPDYEWSMPSATSDTKTNRWRFNYTATLKGAIEE